ncbi:hypothetical protein Y013_23370 [Rhodococcus pyridinivorans SB3094]|uniref:Uncharacterized protein n=1 Tax=Rhodococcus pyridinivorans SB3094 TaxID=1435356 RepID=V9XNG8_9NOCA|nr:hypothetical protein Y013_23370 [Rhodococcus pyridinivorans SB3094]
MIVLQYFSNYSDKLTKFETRIVSGDNIIEVVHDWCRREL